MNVQRMCISPVYLVYPLVLPQRKRKDLLHNNTVTDTVVARGKQKIPAWSPLVGWHMVNCICITVFAATYKREGEYRFTAKDVVAAAAAAAPAQLQRCNI